MADKTTIKSEFDVSSITSRQMARYFKALQTGDIEVQAELLAQTVVSSPLVPSGADVRKADTYLDMPYYEGMGVLIREIQDSLKKAAGN